MLNKIRNDDPYYEYGDEHYETDSEYSDESEYSESDEGETEYTFRFPTGSDEDESDEYDEDDDETNVYLEILELYSQLRTTPQRESVIREEIERLQYALR